MRWPATDRVCGEAWRDLRSGTTSAPLLALAFAMLVALGTSLAAASPLATLSAAEAYRAAGASTLVFRADGRIDGTTCDSLVALPTVRASGALRAADEVTATVLASNPIPAMEVTTGMPSVLSADWNGGAGILLSDDAVDAIVSTGRATDHAVAPRLLDTRQRAIPIAGTFAFPSDGRQGDLGFAALLPVPDSTRTPFDECWVDAWPESAQASEMLRTTLIPGNAEPGADPPTLRQLNGRLGERFPGPDPGSARVSALAPAAVAVAAFALGFGSVRRRRLEQASALHSGVGTATLVGIHAVQGVVWVAAGTALACPVLAVVARSADAASQGALVAIAGLVVGGASAGALAGMGLASLLARERHLFRYFKDR